MFMTVDTEERSFGKCCDELSQGSLSAPCFTHQEDRLTIIYGFDGQGSHSFE
jgi:hypothetical protein